jgi:hypothetical protein
VLASASAQRPGQAVPGGLVDQALRVLTSGVGHQVWVVQHGWLLVLVSCCGDSSFGRRPARHIVSDCVS